MSGVLLTLQIVTGILISMHYHPDASEAFQCVQYFTLNVPNGNFLKYLHANGASTFFILVYLHIAKALFYGSYFKPRQFV
jgi:quinol-cytochrome oxidoreductase complex cytochrome b subunit